MITGNKLFRRGAVCDGGGMLFLYLIKISPPKLFFIKTLKWLCIGLYKPLSQNENNFLNNLSLVINRLNCQYENFMLIGDFNMITKNKNLEVFMNSFGLECLIEKPTCFQ